MQNKLNSPCQEFEGARQTRGYGQVGMKDRDGKTHMVLAHRLAWALHNGEDPGKRCVMHLCDNPPCVNPEHLVIGSLSDNMHDMHSKNRHSLKKLSTEEVAVIRTLLKNGVTGRALAKKFGVSVQHISDIKNNNRRGVQ